MNTKLAYFISELRRDFINECSQKLQEIQMTPGLLYPMLYIGTHPRCSPKAVMESLHMDWGHTQRTLDKLVNDQLITREKNPGDRRSYCLNLTDKGSEVFRKSQEMTVAWNKEKLSVLTPEEQKQLSILLNKLLNTGGKSYV